jgi:hypothetical protein
MSPGSGYLGAAVFAVALAICTAANAKPTLLTESAECEVIAAAAPEVSRSLSYKNGVGASAQVSAERILEDLSAARLGLSDDEMRDLRARASSHEFAASTPSCLWPAIQGDMRTESTRPLFTADERTAVVAWSLNQRDRGESWICVVRKTGDAWRPTCRQTLIWAR